MVIPPRPNALLLCLAVSLALPAGVLGQKAPSRRPAAPPASEVSREAPGSPQETVAALAAKVDDLSLAYPQRETAAIELASLAAGPSGTDARNTIAALLSGAGQRTPEKPEALPTYGVMLRAIARTPEAPRELFPVLSPLVAQKDPRILVELAGALGSIRTVESARELLSLANASKSEPVTAAAFAALGRLTGREDLRRDGPAWSAFLQEASAMSEAQWRDTLAHNLATQADRLADSRRAAAMELTDALRKLHLATPPEDRSAFLAALLNDPVPEARSVAFELISRELSAGRRLEPVVGETVLKLLSDESGLVRENAAVLIKQIGPPGAAPAVMAALLRETDPRPAAAMLQAAARSPTQELVDPALKWLESGSSAASAAADAVWALYRGGYVSDPAIRDRVLAALRSMPVRELTAPGCQLVASLGNDTDRKTLAVLLESDSPALKSATADALALYPEFLDSILSAAANEPQLLETATRAVLMERPTSAGYKAVAALPSSSEDSRRRALLSIAAVLPAPELLDVARSNTTDLAFRESLLALMSSQDRILSERADPEKKAAIADGLILLAETRLALDRPDSAVAALDTLASLDPELDRARTAPLRAMAMLCLNRVEDAQLLNAPASVWLDALEHCIKRPFANTIATAISRRFAGALSDQELARLAMLSTRMPAVESNNLDPEFVGPPAPDR